MSHKFMLFLFIELICISLSATEPLVEKEYYVHDNDNHILYLEMTTTEVESLLGKANEIIVTKIENPLHDSNIISWKYPGVQVSFYDVDDPPIIKEIGIIEGKNNFKLGNVEINKTKKEEIFSLYGIPDSQMSNDGFLFYIYNIASFRKFPYSYILQFKINDNDKCTEIIFLRDDF